MQKLRKRHAKLLRYFQPDLDPVRIEYDVRRIIGYKKGILTRLDRLQFAHNGNDFVENRVTCQVSYFSYKVPRIFERIKKGSSKVTIKKQIFVGSIENMDKGSAKII